MNIHHVLCDPILSPFLFIQSLYASFLKFIGFFIYLYIYIFVSDGHCTYRNTRILILRTLLVQFYILPHTPPRVLFVACVRMYTHVFRVLTADSAWLSKQLKNGSSRPRAFEAADRGKHAYPHSGLQIAETPLYHLRKNSEHSWIAPARQKCTAFTY